MRYGKENMKKRIKKAIEDMIYGLDLSTDEIIFFKFIGCVTLLLIILAIVLILW